MSKVTDLKDWSRCNKIWSMLTSCNIHHLLFWLSPNKFYDNILFWESCFYHYQNFTIYILAFEICNALLNFNRFIVFTYKLLCNLVLSFFLFLGKIVAFIFFWIYPIMPCEIFLIISELISSCTPGFKFCRFQKHLAHVSVKQNYLFFFHCFVCLRLTIKD